MSKGTYVCVYGSICICIKTERERERERARDVYRLSEERTTDPSDLTHMYMYVERERERDLYRLSEERLTDPSDLAHIPLHSLFSTAEALDDLLELIKHRHVCFS
jgi:hypothetical protein